MPKELSSSIMSEGDCSRPKFSRSPASNFTLRFSESFGIAKLSLILNCFETKLRLLWESIQWQTINQIVDKALDFHCASTWM